MVYIHTHTHTHTHTHIWGFPGDSVGKESACNAKGLGLIPGLGRFPGEWNGNLLQYSGLENSRQEPGGLQSMGMQSGTRLSDLQFHIYLQTHTHTHTHTHVYI